MNDDFKKKYRASDRMVAITYWLVVGFIAAFACSIIDGCVWLMWVITKVVAG